MTPKGGTVSPPPPRRKVPLRRKNRNGQGHSTPACAPHAMCCRIRNPRVILRPPQMPRRPNDEFMERHCKTTRGVATDLQGSLPPDLGEALSRAMTHRPDFKDLHGMDPDFAILQDDAFNDVIPAGLPARRAFSRNSGTDPESRALPAAGASVVDKPSPARAETMGHWGRPMCLRPTEYGNSLNDGSPPLVPINGTCPPAWAAQPVGTQPTFNASTKPRPLSVPPPCAKQ